MQLDKRAVRLYFQKDERTVSFVYAEYARLLYHGAYEILHDKEESKDCVQEAFASSFKADDPPKDPKAFVSYLYRSAQNAALSRVRKNSRLEEYPESEPSAGIPERSYSTDELNALKGVLLKKEYDILTLRAGAGYPFRDIAASMEISEGAARSLYRRALGKAKKALKEEDYL